MVADLFVQGDNCIGGGGGGDGDGSNGDDGDSGGKNSGCYGNGDDGVVVVVMMTMTGNIYCTLTAFLASLPHFIYGLKFI
jgi:hypothetical protein